MSKDIGKATIWETFQMQGGLKTFIFFHYGFL